MKNNKSASLFEKEQVLTSLKQSFVKLNPRIMVKNPIMFTVEVCTAIMFLVMIYSIFDNAQGSFVYNAWVLLSCLSHYYSPTSPKLSLRPEAKHKPIV